jgi:RNA polymerase sigma-70 factor (ECF subfamily)
MLSTSQPAVKGAVQRARAALRPRTGQAGRAGPGSARERDLGRRFASAYVAGVVDAVVALLSDDAWLSMPPAPHEYHGPGAIAAFLRASFGWRAGRRVRLVAARANTQPAFGSYLSADASAGGGAAAPAGLIVLTAGGDRLQAITRFHLPAIYPRFGLPGSLPGPPDGPGA